MKLIIMDQNGEFWTGTGWTKEYPDARVYRDWTSVNYGYRKAKGERDCDVISHYGFADETIIGM